MINLLPPDDKRQLRASRANTLLLRYNVLLLGALAFMLVAIGVAYVFLTNTQASAEQAYKDNQKEDSSYAAIKEKEQQFRSNLDRAKTILDKEVIYTRTILAISQLLPSGIVLQNLNLDSKTFGTQTTLTVQSRDVQAAVNLKKALESSRLFTNVHFQSIQTAGGAGAYPITVSLNVTINKEAALRTTSEEPSQSVEEQQTAVPGVSP